MKRPWFSFYVADWMLDLGVMAMTLPERGAYMHLLCIQWREGFIPNNQATVYQLLGLCYGNRLTDTDNEGLFDIGKVLAKFDIDEENTGQLKNSRLEEIRAEADELSQARAEAGKKGGLSKAKAKQKRGSSKAQANTIAKPSQSQSQSQSQEDINISARACVEPKAFAALWARATGVLMPDASTLGEARRLVEAYAEAVGESATLVAERSVKDFCALVDSWDTPSAKTPSLFLKHWDSIQSMLAGKHDPKAKKKAGARREEAPVHQPRPASEVLAEMPGIVEHTPEEEQEIRAMVRQALR